MDALTPDYICTKFKNVSLPCGIKITMTIKHFNLDDGKVLFKISILKNYSEIHVCVRDGMHFIRNDEINTIKYIYFEQFTILENHISYYNNNTIWNDQFPFTESPLYKFCNYVVKNNTNSPIFLK